MSTRRESGCLMYQIAYIGRWETLPETAAAICDHDTPKLEALLQGGLDLGAPIQLSEYIKLMPLETAVFRNDVPMIHFLLEHGADPGLAEEQPLLLTAARCCGPEVVSLFAEQAAKLSPKQKERAFQEVRWGKRPENIPVLEQAGITVNKFGGESFRAAVSEGNTKLARLLLEKGADINYHKPDMVFPYASTPVTEAARSNNFPMVRWLIEQGADITIADKYGDHRDLHRRRHSFPTRRSSDLGWEHLNPDRLGAAPPAWACHGHRWRQPFPGGSPSGQYMQFGKIGRAHV